jgi:hypothetical protein
LDERRAGAKSAMYCDLPSLETARTSMRLAIEAAINTNPPTPATNASRDVRSCGPTIESVAVDGYAPPLLESGFGRCARQSHPFADALDGYPV